MIEASVPALIVFRVIREDVDDLYKWKTFWLSSLHQRQISHMDHQHAKSGTDEGYSAKTSAIYINLQHLRRLHKKRITVGTLTSIVRMRNLALMKAIY